MSVYRILSDHYHCYKQIHVIKLKKTVIQMHAKKDPILLKMDKNNTLNTYRKV